MILYILRGLPGSGKSTLARELMRLYESENPQWFEADMWHMVDGTYQWKADRVSFAHEQCQSHVKKAMELHHGVIIVSNTFTREWEMEPYINMCREHGYTYYSLIVENRHGNENIHNVPKANINKMRERFEIQL